MDNIEEQRGELEVVQAIFPEELEVLSAEAPIRFRVRINPPDGSEFRLVGAVVFEFVPEYPAVPPRISVEAIEDMSPGQCEEMTEFLLLEANNYLGSSMVFNLVEVAKSWLSERCMSMHQQMLQRMTQQTEIQPSDEMMHEAGAKQEREILTTIIPGEPVTRENFVEWKAAFDAERRAAGLVQEQAQAPTGRQLFERHEAVVDLAAIRAAVAAARAEALASAAAAAATTSAAESAAAAGSAAASASAAAAAAADVPVDESLFDDDFDLDEI